METEIKIKQKIHYAVIKDFRKNEKNSEDNWQEPVYSKLYVGTDEEELSDLVCGFLDLYVDEDKASELSGSRYTASRELRSIIGSFVRNHKLDKFDEALKVEEKKWGNEEKPSYYFDQDMSQVQIVYGFKEIEHKVDSWSRSTFVKDILYVVSIFFF